MNIKPSRERKRAIPPCSGSSAALYFMSETKGKLIVGLFNDRPFIMTSHKTDVSREYPNAMEFQGD